MQFHLKPHLSCLVDNFPRDDHLNALTNEIEKNWNFESWITNLKNLNPYAFRSNPGEFKNQNIDITYQFLRNIGENWNSAFWTVYLWMCGVNSLEQIQYVFQHKLVDTMVFLNLDYPSEWHRMLRLNILQCTQEFFANRECINSKSVTDFSQFLLYKQLMCEHNALICCARNTRDTIQKSRVLFTCDNDIIAELISRFPIHSISCLKCIPHIELNQEYTFPPEQDWCDTQVIFKSRKHSNSVFIISAEIHIFAKQHEYNNVFDSDCEAKFDDIPMGLQSSWIELQSSNSPSDLMNYVPDCIPSLPIQYMNRIDLVQKYIKIIDWMRYHDNRDILKCISVRFSKHIRGSPFFKIIDHKNTQKGAVIMFKNCQARAIVTLAMCERTRQTELKNFKTRTLLITSAHLLNFWEDNIIALCKTINCHRLVSKVDNDTRSSTIFNSRYVIVSTNQFRSTSQFAHHEWFRIIIDNACSLTPNTATYNNIQALKSSRKWCLSLQLSQQIVNLFGLINMWDIVSKPNTQSSREIYECTRELCLTAESKSAVSREHIHFCTLESKTKDKLDTFSIRIHQTKMHRAKFVRPLLNILSSGLNIKEAKLWDVFFVEKVLPAYVALPEAKHHGFTSGHCVVCHDQPLEKPVQFQCSHILCYGCANLVQKCPLCRQEIVEWFKPTNTKLLYTNILTCNTKYKEIYSFINTLPEHSKIIFVTPFNVSEGVPDISDRHVTYLDSRNIEKCLQDFITSSSSIIIIPRKFLHLIHCEYISHIIIPFAKDRNIPICTCSSSVQIHFFIFKASIEEYMLLHQHDWKTKRFWDHYIEFLQHI